MLFDKQSTFSDKQSLVSAAATVVSTNILDTGVAADPGVGEPVFVSARIDTSFTGTAGGTLQIQLQTSVDAAFTSPVIVEQTALLSTNAAAATAAGVVVQWRLQRGMLRYIRLAYVIATQSTTAGAITAGITKDQDYYTMLPSGRTY